MKKIVFLLNFTPPPRMIKRIRVAKEIFETFVIFWDKGGDDKFDYHESGVTNHRILIPANRNNPVKRILPTLNFQRKAMTLLKNIRPDIIHVQSYDMLETAYRYRKTVDKNCKLIYEVPDIHSYLTEDAHPFPINLISHRFKRREKMMGSMVDLLILTSMQFWPHFENWFPKERMLFLPNIPNLSHFSDYENLRLSKTAPFTVGYIGGLRYLEELKLLVAAMEGENMRLLMAGFEDGHYFKDLAEEKDFIDYYGKFFYDDSIASLYAKCDVIYSIYDASKKNVRIALPNKLYESVHCHLPIMVAKDTYLAEIVQDWGVGIAAKHNDREEIKAALMKLYKDRSFYDFCVENAKKKAPELSSEKVASDYRKRIIQL